MIKIKIKIMIMMVDGYGHDLFPVSIVLFLFC